MLFNHIKRTEMVKNVQLYENPRDSSAAYAVSVRRLAHAKTAALHRHRSHAKAHCSSLQKVRCYTQKAARGHANARQGARKPAG